MKNTQQLLSNARVTILVGEFGSGKTELAVNYALYLKDNGYSTAIVDIDIIKPYFRTRENRSLLEAQGIRVIAPEGRLAHADLPVLPQNLFPALYDTSMQVVMDVGGGESSIALGQISSQLAAVGYEALLVVNTCRPFTSTSEGIVEAVRRIQQASQLTVSGLISNTNLADETNLLQVLKGLEITEEAARQLQVPVRAVVVPESLSMADLPVPVFVLKRYTHYPWMD
ncbi:MAG TPA: hypothetical protein DCP36_03435 [Sporomusaceae bacterium]|jgi:hypothetical protein|uniref:zeta toxin family protein n=1 Tax=Anaerospora sp. TaxID=1960278 RepID=UPI000ED1350D|nr:hypothetical protein [Anaerospora sp.]MDF2928201.1 hypothetical protein [Anaerospora sp.]HAK72864.1 hypothetical protein [Sporomusaceae bacterium]